MATVLIVLAVAVTTLTIVACLYLLWEAASAESVDRSRILLVLAGLVGGLSLAGILMAAGAFLGYQANMAQSFRWEGVDLERVARGLEEVSQRLRQVGGGSRPPELAGPDKGRSDQHELHMLHLLRDIAENTLLSDSQRQQKRERLAARESQRLVQAVEQHMQEGAWDRARESLKQLAQRFPNLPNLPVLQERFATEASASEERDVGVASLRIGELTKDSQWQQARQVAEEVIGKHPHSEAAQALLTRVEQGESTYHQEARTKFYAEVERGCAERDWASALSAGEALISRYSASSEAEQVRSQLQTLRENAEIQHRQALESQIKELVHRQAYRQALAAAQDLLNRYPASPQASALRPQISRLEQLVREQESGGGSGSPQVPGRTS